MGIAINKNGTAGFKGQSVHGDDLDELVLFGGATLPGATNDIPQGGYFLLTAVDGINVKGIYEQTSATKASPAWGLRFREVAGQAGDQLYPLSVTIGDYSVPVAAVATSSKAANVVLPLTSTTNWTELGTPDINLDAVTNFRIDWVGGYAGGERTYYDIGAGNMSDSICAIRFKIRFNNAVAGGNGKPLYCVLSDATTDTNSSQDCYGFGIFRISSVGDRIAFATYDSDGAALPNVLSYENVSSSTSYATATDYFVTLLRTSATAFKVIIRSTSHTGTIIDTVIGTVASSQTGMRYLKFMQDADGAAENGSLDGTIDDIDIYYNDLPHDAGFATDNDVTTRWESLSENNPAIYIDTGAAQEIVALAVNIDKTITTELEIDVRVSTDTTFIAGEDVRSILLSDFADDTYRYISLPRLADNRRYVQIRGIGTSKILSINEIKYRAATDLDRLHYHDYLNPNSIASNGEDSN